MSTTPPWLELARNELGTAEVPGRAANSKIVSFYADAGHPEVVSDEVSWCSAFCCAMVKRAGYPIPPVDTNLLARSWRTYGVKLDKPVPGCIGVWPRGAAWQGHVGIVSEVLPNGTVKLLGGNQGKIGKVSYATYKTADAIAFRMPVKATVADLRAAGSTDIQLGDTLQKASVGLSLLTGAAAAADAVSGPAEAVSSALDIKEAMQQTAEHLALTEKVMKGAINVGTLVAAHPWIVAILFTCGTMAILGWRYKQHRLKRHAQGHVLSGQA